jgi:predicted outer membrane protein
MDADAYRQARTALVGAIGRLTDLNATGKGAAEEAVLAAQAEVEAATRAVRVIEAEMVRQEQSK